MGMFERFFHVALILTLILISCNMSLMVFSSPLLGENKGETSLVVSTGVDANTLTTVNKITQSSLFPNFPSLDPTTGVGSIIDFVVNLVGNYRIVLQKVFVDVDKDQMCDYLLTFPIGTCNDAPELFGTMLLNLILVFQVIGLIYLPFAMWSAVVGGGSP